MALPINIHLFIASRDFIFSHREYLSEQGDARTPNEKKELQQQKLLRKSRECKEKTL